MLYVESALNVIVSPAAQLSTTMLLTVSWLGQVTVCPETESAERVHEPKSGFPPVVAVRKPPPLPAPHPLTPAASIANTPAATPDLENWTKAYLLKPTRRMNGGLPTDLSP